MLEDARLAHALGHGAGRLVRARRAVWLPAADRSAGQCRAVWVRRDNSRSSGTGTSDRVPKILMRVEFDGLAGLEVSGRADALDVGDAERLAGRVVSDAAGEPADGDQAAQAGLAGLEVEDGHGVLGAVADEELAAGLIEGERVGLRPEQVRGVLPRADRLDDLVRARVNDAERVAARVGDHDPAAVGRGGHRAGVQAGQDFGLAGCGLRTWLPVRRGRGQ